MTVEFGDDILTIFPYNIVSLNVYHGLLLLTMDAILVTIVAGGQAQILLNIEVDTNVLISTLIY